MLENEDDLESLAETSEEEALAGATKKTTVAKAKANAKDGKLGYRLPKGLEASRSTQYSTRALFDQIIQGDIELNPDYQRDIVWSEQKQIGLIDSIFRNFYVPPVIFTVRSAEDGAERRTCIDGKQRLTSIRRFLSGEIPYVDPKVVSNTISYNQSNIIHRFTKEKLWFAENSRDPKRIIFSSSYRNLFQNKQVVCVEYNNLSDAQEREIFQRVQLGMALTTAEKMQAIHGPWAELCREVSDEFVNKEDGLSATLDWDRKRSRDFHNVSQSIFSIAQLPTFVHVTTAQLEKLLGQKEGPTPTIRQRIMDTFHIFRDIAKDKKLRVPLAQPSRVAPIEFIMVSVLIAKFMDQLSLPQLSQAIGILRQEVREQHEDVRNNSKIFRSICTIINDKISPTTLQKTPGLPVAAQTLNDGSIKTQNGASGRKRSHDAMEVGSEEPWASTRTVRGAPSDSIARSHETVEMVQSLSEQTKVPNNWGKLSQSINDALAQLNATKAEVQNKYQANNPMQRLFVPPSTQSINNAENDTQKVTPSTTSPVPSIPSPHSTPRDGSLSLPQRPYGPSYDSSSYQDPVARNSRYASTKESREYSNRDGRSERRDYYSRDADKEREWRDRYGDRERERERDRWRDRERGHERDRRHNQ